MATDEDSLDLFMQELESKNGALSVTAINRAPAPPAMTDLYSFFLPPTSSLNAENLLTTNEARIGNATSVRVPQMDRHRTSIRHLQRALNAGPAPQQRFRNNNDIRRRRRHTDARIDDIMRQPLRPRTPPRIPSDFDAELEPPLTHQVTEPIVEQHQGPPSPPRQRHNLTQHSEQLEIWDVVQGYRRADRGTLDEDDRCPICLDALRESVQEVVRPNMSPPQPNTNNTSRNRSALNRSSSLPSLPSFSLSFSFTSTSTSTPHPSVSPGFLHRIRHGTQRLNLIEAPEEYYSMSSSSSSSSGYVGLDSDSDEDDDEFGPLRGSKEALEFVLAHTEDAVPEAISEERNACPVCLLPFWLGAESEGEGEAEVCHLPKVTRCGHFFGMQCLMDDLVRRGTRCAFCRQELDGEENEEEEEEEEEEKEKEVKEEENEEEN
ncbi:hypothetical protein BS50DRAFT_670565 [Corynespora cassiicola Philippines]|uniref:RING-type domain-containing protein n=1 Tax=Corynespora cassiicola Philippines TaxID=1448308 RepID=A0A2T2P941_CORCC|nr:hypothetical protein BS50DRAFT_670565 [Corynespora cassiicola Philippines]